MHDSRAGPDDAAEPPSRRGAGGREREAPIISGNGRIVAFTTADPGIVGYDSNGVDDVFAVDRDPDGNGVFDEQPPTFTHISLRPGGALYTTPLSRSRSARTGAGSRTRRIRRWGSSIARPATTRSCRDMHQPIIGTGQFSTDGRYFVLGFGTGTCSSAWIAIPTWTEVFDEPGAVDVGGPVSYPSAGGPHSDGALRSIFDLPTAQSEDSRCETSLGPAPPLYDRRRRRTGQRVRDPFRPRSNVGRRRGRPGGDPDGDGQTNLEEQLAGTHPRGMQTRYLAEGATGTFFSTRIAVANPGTTPAARASALPDGHRAHDVDAARTCRPAPAGSSTSAACPAWPRPRSRPSSRPTPRSSSDRSMFWGTPDLRIARGDEPGPARSTLVVPRGRRDARRVRSVLSAPESGPDDRG